jgi:valyl-tRNA synthetase
MALFRRKKPVIQPDHDYTQTEKEFTFLSLILTRKKNITKEFIINVYTTQQSDGDYLRDEDIEDIIGKIVNEVISEIGDNYKNYLVKHYFGSFENLVKYISEDVYVDLVADAINRNSKKSSTMLAKKATEVISKLNKK